jgi:hypothetical protein
VSKFLAKSFIDKSMAEKTPIVKHYLIEDVSIGLKSSYYVETVEKEERGEKLYSFLYFTLLENGEIGPRETIINKMAADVHELIELIQRDSREISEEEFRRAETEYLRLASKLNESWRSSDLYKKLYGVDVVTNEEKDVMDRLSKLLKRTKET